MADTVSTETRPATGTGVHGAANCEWAAPALWLAAPFWFDAERTPWACLRDGAPRLLDTTESCATCVRWQPRFAGMHGSAAAPDATANPRWLNPPWLDWLANPPWLDWLAGYPAPHETDRP